MAGGGGLNRGNTVLTKFEMSVILRETLSTKVAESIPELQGNGVTSKKNKTIGS